MRSKILRELMDHSDTFVSGQKLCKTFGVSRQAVWKNICCLKELGYDIESVTNKGYRLISKPDILYGPEIEAYLEEESFCQKSNVMIALTRQTSEANNLQNWEKLREH